MATEKARAACFTEQGIYHDGFYGEFAGRAQIAGMVCNFFHRDACGFNWRLVARRGLIERYDEVFERAPVLAALEFSDERILKSIRRCCTV